MSAADQIEATHVYCWRCDSIEMAVFTALDSISADGMHYGGNIVCGECTRVLLHVFKESDA